MYSTLELYTHISDDTIKENYRTEKHLQKRIVYIEPKFSPSIKWKIYDSIISDPKSLSLVTPTYVLMLSLNGWTELDSNVIIYTTDSLKQSIQDQFSNHVIRLTNFTNIEEQIYNICMDLEYDKLYWTYTTRGIATNIPAYTKESDVFPKLIFIQQYYHPKEIERRNEIDFCVKNNIENPYLDKLVLLNENDSIRTPYTSSKIEYNNINKRMMFSDVYKYIQEKVEKNVICLYGNSDMYLGDMTKLYNIDMDKKFLALLRWDITDMNTQAHSIFGPRSDSQDVWGVLSDNIHNININTMNINFYFGVPGCDNAIITIMNRNGFNSINPVYDIKTYHVHLTNMRNYTNLDRVTIEYTFLSPIGIF
jgi:hypothetical protein